MAQNVVNGAMLKCSFGLAPSSLVVLPMNRVLIEGQPAANIQDAKPMLNILPFGMCITLSNPTVAAATAAALGVLTPMPCIPVTTAWLPGTPTTLVGGAPGVNSTCQCICAYGGVINVAFPGAVKTMTT